MGFKHYTSKIGILFAKNYFPEEVSPRDYPYNPLINGEQTLALIKKFRLNCVGERTLWGVQCGSASAEGDDLNRAVCECVAKMEMDRRFGQPHHGH